jgi:hypothetical protein
MWNAMLPIRASEEDAAAAKGVSFLPKYPP